MKSLDRINVGRLDEMCHYKINSIKKPKRGFQVIGDSDLMWWIKISMNFVCMQDS